ncbi:MAG: hypothetical protein V4717_24285 [Bacteroidota bacterium]
MTCFVIMPITDSEPYKKGHFGRVYEHLIKPACVLAGFEPIRADEILNTNYIAIDIIRKLLNSEMAICDLSSRNPNVLYELGIRQAFNLPVTLLKDSVTQRVFDISGFRDIEYDENLRIDNVERDIETLTETIKNTYETRGKEVNSLVTLLGIKPANLTESVDISKDTEVILNYLSALNKKVNDIEDNIIKKVSPKNGMSIQNNYTVKDRSGEEINVDDIIDHEKFGSGKIIKVEGASHNPIITVQFADKQLKIMTNYANFRKTIPI